MLGILDQSCLFCIDVSVAVVFTQARLSRSPLRTSEMPSPRVLKPVLKMKVDELFHIWLSDPATHSLLNGYLDLIKSGQHIDLSKEGAHNKRSLTIKENNNVPSPQKLCESKGAPPSSPSSPPSASALPCGTHSSTRMTGLSSRGVRRSVSKRKVNYLL